LDLISSWQIGIKNIVAIKGTALTDDQINILSRFSSSLVLALDSDFAGDKAATRGLVLAQEIGLDISIAELKSFKDPDDYAKADPKGLIKVLENSVPVWDFLIDSIFSKYKKLEGPEKGKISREISPWLSQIPDPILKAHYIKKVANRLDVPEEAVLEKVESILKKPISKPEKINLKKIAENFWRKVFYFLS
jgi:DNA primase